MSDTSLPILACAIKAVNPLKCTIGAVGQISGKIRYVDGGIQATEYTGSYSVVPAVVAQTLPTKNTVLRDDVSVQKIPTYEVSNLYGGKTFVIGEMSDYGN